MTGLPLARARDAACWRTSAAFTVSRSGWIMPCPLAIGVPNKDAIIAGRQMRRRLEKRRRDKTAAKEHLPPLAAVLIRRRFSLPPLFHHNHLLGEASPVDDQLIDVHTGCRFTVGLQNLAIPVRRERAGRRSRGAARQLEIVEILARALKNRHGDELRQHVVDLE